MLTPREVLGPLDFGHPVSSRAVICQPAVLQLKVRLLFSEIQ